MFVWSSHTYSKSKDQPGKVTNPVRGQQNRKMNTRISLSTFAFENFVSRDGFGSPVSRQHSSKVPNLSSRAGFFSISLSTCENSINQASKLRHDARHNLMTQYLNIDQVRTYYVVGKEITLGVGVQPFNRCCCCCLSHIN